MLYIISAPSGGGKTSLVRALVSRVGNLVISVSHTTRQKREGEVDGVNYHFVSKAHFEKLVAENNFLEYAEVFGHWYGTSKAWVSEQMQSGNDVILEIDWQGAQQIRALFKETISIFIMPPSMEVLHERLNERRQDSEDIIRKRMHEAKAECSHFNEFDYLIINDDFDIAVSELETIVYAERLRTPIQRKKHEKLLERILSV